MADKSAVLNAIGVFFSSILIWVMMFGLLVLLIARARLREKRHEFATIVIAFVASVGAYVTNTLISFIYFRPRPFAALADVHLLITKSAAEKSFPSDHSALAFAIAVSVYLIHKKAGFVFLLAAVFVALGRVFVGVHYLSDVLIGAIIGGIWAIVVDKVGRKSFEKIFFKK